MLGASLSRRRETLARRPLLRSSAAQNALYGSGSGFGFTRRHSIARRDRRIIIRSPVRIRRLCPVQCEDRQGRAEQQSGDGLEIIPAARLRLAFFAEIARSKADTRLDRKSTRLNSSHLGISYAVFCLKKK